MIRTKLTAITNKFFKDKNGIWAIAQFPNALLITWIVLSIVILFLNSTPILRSLVFLQTVVLVAWAFMEATRGDSYFRKSLGLIALAIIIVSFFR